MLIGVVSDIHANSPALRAVLHKLDALKVVKIFCLGDVIGYGPDPNECVDMLNARHVVGVRGNHEEALANPNFRSFMNKSAAEMLDWTANQLCKSKQKILTTLPVVRFDKKTSCVLVHGTLPPNDEGIDVERAVCTYAADFYWAQSLKEVKTQFPDARFLFLGHTHVPCAYAGYVKDGSIAICQKLDEGCLTKAFEPIQMKGDKIQFQWDPTKEYVFGFNPGSVGKTRLGDPGNAHFLIVDLQTNGFVASFMATRYSLQKTLNQIQKKMPLAVAKTIITDLAAGR